MDIDKKISIKFNYNKGSYAIYESIDNDDFSKHERELFCNNDFKSDFFMKYDEYDSSPGLKNKYIFPFPVYGYLDTFWKDQTKLTNEKKNNLKKKWIYQLTQGLKELHSRDKYYGQLSSKCITIDYQKNVKYTFLYESLEDKHSYRRTSYLYLPPEYIKEKKEAKNNDIRVKQSYDVYALGILLNGIIQESFPDINDYRTLSEEEVKDILKDPKNNYPKKEKDDPFWREFYNQVIDSCLKTDDRPTINDISEKLDHFFQKEEINTEFVYDSKTVSILDSIEVNDFEISSLLRKLIGFNDIANVINLLKKKYGSLLHFFDVELYYPSPFKSPIPCFDFQFNFSPQKINNERFDHLFSSIVEPHFKENYDEGDEVEDEYVEINQDQFETIEQEIKKNYILSNFCLNSLVFCNLNQFIRYQYNFKEINKIIIEREDILAWFIYLAHYMTFLENEKMDKPLLPKGFSSETILVSLLSNSKGKPQFQLSIFPFPTQETKLSKIYQSESDNIDPDIYSFGVLMFEILGFIPCNTNEKVNFDSEVLNSLYSEFQKLNESFNINNSNLDKLMDLIQRCLTPGDQPTFEMIELILCNVNNPVIKGIDMNTSLINYEYYKQNQCMDLERLASIAYLFETDNVNSIVSHFMNETSKDSDDDDDGYFDGYHEKNPFKKIIMKFARSEFDEDFKDPFNFIYLLYLKDKELTPQVDQDDSQSTIQSAIHPYLQRLESIKQKLLQTKIDYDQKCKELDPSKLDFDNLTINSALSGLTTIINNWSPLIPHTLLIHVNTSNLKQVPNDGEANNNNDDNENTTIIPPKQICTLSHLVEFAKQNNIKYKTYKKQKIIKMYFPRKEDIFGVLNLDLPNNNDDDYIMSDENEEEEEEEGHEEEDKDI